MSSTYGEIIEAICKLSQQEYSLSRALNIIPDSIIEMTLTMGFSGYDIIEKLETNYKDNIKLI